MSGKRYRVSEVARLAGVTVRTLHHYDEIGLLSPSGRSAAGYRLYASDDLLRLQQIVIGRTLGMSLEQIRRMLDDPDFDHAAALRRQRAELVDRAEETRRMIGAIDAALRKLEPQPNGDETMHDQPEQLFDGFDPSQYEDEAEQRWGHTESYAESARRTKGYTPDDWKRLKAEADEIMRALVQAKDEGAAADGERAMDLAERHRQHIDRWFYPCSHAMHEGLSSMYLADARFAAHFEKYGEGLTKYLVEAIVANGGRRP